MANKNGKLLKKFPWRLKMPPSHTQEYNTKWKAIKYFEKTKKPNLREMEEFLKGLGLLCLASLLSEIIPAYIFYILN